MFKHPDEGIWVPLREIHWWWSGDAQLNANTNKWELKNSGNIENPESQESTKLPEWNGNTKSQPEFKLIE